MPISTPFNHKRLPRDADDSDTDSSASSPAFPFERFPRLPAGLVQRKYSSLFRANLLSRITAQPTGYEQTGACSAKRTKKDAVETPHRHRKAGAVSLPSAPEKEPADAVDYHAAVAELARLSSLSSCPVRRLRPMRSSPPLEMAAVVTAGHTAYKKRRLEEKREMGGEGEEREVETMTIRRV
jgi:hypothetical protein